MLRICQHISRNILIYFQYFYCVGIFLQFSTYFYILSVFSEGKGKGKGRAAAGESVTSHACIRQNPWRAFVGWRLSPYKVKKTTTPWWASSPLSGSFLAFACLITRQTGYYTGSRRIRLVPGGFHGCPVRWYCRLSLPWWHQRSGWWRVCGLR